jgi:hypothetical protein
MPAKTHTRRADAPIARAEREESGDCQRGIFVIGCDFLQAEKRKLSVALMDEARRCDANLLDLVVVAGVGAGTVVG